MCVLHAGITMDEAQIASISQRAEDLDIPVRSFRHTTSDTVLLLYPLNEAELYFCPVLQICVHACPLLWGCYNCHKGKTHSTSTGLRPSPCMTKCCHGVNASECVTHSVREELSRHLHKQFSSIGVYASCL